MRYILIRKHGLETIDCDSDLSVRRIAMADRTVIQVHTERSRVVYRNVPEPTPRPKYRTKLRRAIEAAQEIGLPDVNLIEWFDRAKERK